MSFRAEIERAINRNSREGGSDTPDFVLAEYLEGCLEVFDKALVARERYYGREKPVGPQDVDGDSGAVHGV